MTDQHRKTLRSFYCRDYLWDLFEVMTRDLGCSMDYLINESMRHYARSRNYSLTGADAAPAGAGAGAPPPPSPPGYGAPPPPYGAPAPPPPPVAPPGAYAQPGPGHSSQSTFERMPAIRNTLQPQAAPRPYGAPTPPPPPPVPGAPPPPYGQQRSAPPPPPPMSTPPGAPPPPRVPPGYGAPQPPAPHAPHAQHAPPPPAPAPMPPVDHGHMGGEPHQQNLSLIYNNQRYRVEKDKFIIGRGSNMTDLTIRDGNISRKHAAVIFRNGAYYIKDLDSTNGIDYRGNRIDSKKIEEGDVFHICDYEFRFTYQ